MAYHAEVSFSDVGFCKKILNLLWKENLIRGYTKYNNGFITVYLKYHEGRPMCERLIVLSKPRDRFYLSWIDLYRASEDFGVLIVSNPKGIMTAKEAVRRGEGGEVLAYFS